LSAAARQISSVSVAISEEFYPPLTHCWHYKGISTDMTKLVKDVCSRTVLLYDRFNHSTLLKQYSIYSHFVTVHYR
jgi:hypothetical protein